MSPSSSYDIAVLGAGMLGSSCAKHLAKDYPGLRIALIGPDECRTNESAGGCFGAWFDEGRITRIFDSSPFWETLGTYISTPLNIVGLEKDAVFSAHESIKRYRSIESESGIPFFTECGFLTINTPGLNKDLKAFHNSAKSVQLKGHECQRIQGADDWKRRFPYMTGVPKDHQALGYYQPDTAGAA